MVRQVRLLFDAAELLHTRELGTGSLGSRIKLGIQEIQAAELFQLLK